MDSGERKHSFFSRGSLLGLLITAATLVGLVVDTSLAGNSTESPAKSDFYTDYQLFDEVAKQIHIRYVEDINSTDLFDAAIKGMLGILDPHTAYEKPKDFEELRIHTEGKFGGLGIQIALREKILTVMTPISGTPAERAGIQTGDRIVKIDGKSTQGITVDKAVEKLRGEPGTPVAITILRKGESSPIEYTIVREVIVIKSVPFYGVIDNGIGYVKLNQFSQESGEEMEKAVRDLMQKGAKGFILDMRHNPGGLLQQAQTVSEKFLKKGDLIVSTRGRVSPEQTMESRSDAMIPDSIPLVVLVDEASASAAEIVSGAIQDHDRGVILGDTTFGKGSVQSLEPLNTTLGRDYHLKLTTAFYYTPSGRCINKPENGIRGAKHDEEADLDDAGDGDASNESFDSTASAKKTESAKVKKDTLVYHTSAGRVVYGGGGIIPDTIVQLPFIEPVIRALFVKDAFFKFTNNVFPDMARRNVKVDAVYQPDDKLMKEFYNYLDSTKFDFRPYASVKYDEFRKWAGILADTTADSARYSIDRPDWTKEERAELDKMSAQVSALLTAEGKREMASRDEDVKRYVREAVLIRALGQDNETVFRARLAVDPQVKAALGLLGDRQAYSRLLKPAKKK